MLTSARILVADDDRELLHAIREALAQRGALVACAESGAELIECLAQEGPFELIISDVSMPWGSGLQAMHSARTAGVDTAVIVMTALQDESIGAQVLALGSNAVLLRKPFALGDLEAVAVELLTLDLPGSAQAAEFEANEPAATEWASHVAHDLQQPLNTLLLRADLFLRTARLSPKQREGLLRIRALTKRLGAVVDELRTTPPNDVRADLFD